ncbi:hypothetical protein OSTOST_07780, partial [Ostertagia ostertagi]
MALHAKTSPFRSFSHSFHFSPIPSAIERKLSERRRRPLSPTMLPGVRSLPKEVSETLRSQLVPGEYYAKSVTQYLGPFDHEPTAAELPSGDDYFILQSMGRMRETGKVIFRNVRQLSIPARVVPPPRPISPSELPGVRPLTNELDENTRNNLVPGKYFAKSMTRYLGPYDSFQRSIRFQRASLMSFSRKWGDFLRVQFFVRSLKLTDNCSD